MFQPPTRYFEVQPIKAVEVAEPSWKTDEAKKSEFGIALARNAVPFNAACEVFKDNTNAALWISIHWLNDPVVVASKELYQKSFSSAQKNLDKDQLAAKVIEFAEEKDPIGRFYIVEPKDRLAALRLYAELQGYIGKNETNFNNFTNNEMKIVLVKSNNNNDNLKTIEAKTIDSQANTIVNNPLPLNIKLVKA